MESVDIMESMDGVVSQILLRIRAQQRARMEVTCERINLVFSGRCQEALKSTKVLVIRVRDDL